MSETIDDSKVIDNITGCIILMRRPEPAVVSVEYGIPSSNNDD